MVKSAVNSDVLQQFVGRAGSLYSLPAVAMEVLELTAEPSLDTAALRECVERDPALTAKLLRVVNSSLFGLSCEVSDLKQALALLGVKPLKLLVLGFSLPSDLYDGLEATALREFWRGTLVQAVAAREFSQSYWRRSGDESFIAGLLREIGTLVLIQQLGNSYLEFLRAAHQQQGDPDALERETLGFDHAALSGRLLAHWGLPDGIVSAVSMPLELEPLCQLEPGLADLPQTLHLAHLVTLLLVHDRHDVVPLLLEAADRYQGISIAQIEETLDKLEAQVEVMAGIFAVRWERQEPFREIMQRAHQQLATAAEDAVPLLAGKTNEAFDRQRSALHSAMSSYTDAHQRTSCNADGTASERPAGLSRASQCSRENRLRGRLTPELTADPGLVGRLESAIAACRLDRSEVSLALVEPDSYSQLLVGEGLEDTTLLARAVRQVVERLADAPAETIMISDSRCAILLPACDRQQAVTLLRRVNQTVPALLLRQRTVREPFSMSAGIASLATPTRSSRPEDLVEAADRCLFAAVRSGGGATKSIDVL